ncbi:MAG: hypothetical protein A2Z20_06865 [Bdellovibrionales bacterium RBG_16_40_8]|nr:MAG: hypothetical protein A2Z20_06865 [Bdellovibrionales bacterium RBG_16_40_8]
MKLRLSLANFLQVFPFCLVLVHGVFLRGGLNNEYHWAIVFSMGLYSALQVGGVWLISWMPRRVLTETYFWNALRVLGGVFYLVDNSFLIILGAGLIGLSQALFYRFSRQMVSNFWKSNQTEVDQVYTLMALALNIAFLILPVTGAALIKYFSTSILMGVAILFSIAGVLLIKGAQDHWRGDCQNNEDHVVQSKNSNEVISETKLNLREVFEDLFYLGSFVIPYGIMVALIPLKTKASGMSIDTNGKLFSLNAFVVISVLIIKSFFAKASLSKLDLTKSLSSMSFISWILVILSGLAPLNWLVLAFVVWSLFEALQLPTIERHIFSNRSYSSKWVDRILVIDALGSFAAPLFASMLISLQGGIF